MAGEFMRTLDSFTVFVRGILSFIFFGILFLSVAGPYVLYRSAADAITRATSKTRVWICEVNSAFYWDDETGCWEDINNPQKQGKLPFPFPLVSGKGKDSPVVRYYACVNSVKEAEDWLLAHDYKKTTIETDSMPPNRPENEVTKEFFIRNVAGTKAYSVVGLLIDYGDYDIHLVPFSYPVRGTPVNFSRFQNEDFKATGGRQTIDVPHTQMCIHMPPLVWCSTDGYCSHTFGGRICGNNATILEYNKEYGMGRYIELVKD